MEGLAFGGHKRCVSDDLAWLGFISDFDYYLIEVG